MANVAHPKHNAAMSHGRLEGVTKPPVRGGGGRGGGMRRVRRAAGRGAPVVWRRMKGKRRAGIERKGSIRADAPPRERRPACFIVTGVAPRVSTRVPRVEVCASGHDDAFETSRSSSAQRASSDEISDERGEVRVCRQQAAGKTLAPPRRLRRLFPLPPHAFGGHTPLRRSASAYALSITAPYSA